MKVLSVPQPYASLMAAGIVDFMNDNWSPKDTSLRILIHANKKGISKRSFIANEPIEWFQEVFNHITFGNIPDFKNMPHGAIIGYVTVDKTDKVCDDAGVSYNWHFKDAYLFDKPIAGVKGRPRLWDYKLDEDNLPPAHKVIINEARFHDQNIHIHIPICKSLWDNLKPNDVITLELTEALREQYNNELYPLLAFDVSYYVQFTFKGQKRLFSLKYRKMYDDNDLDWDVPEWYIGHETNEDGTPCMYYSYYHDEEKREFITFVLGKEIK